MTFLVYDTQCGKDLYQSTNEGEERERRRCEANQKRKIGKGKNSPVEPSICRDEVGHGIK